MKKIIGKIKNKSNLKNRFKLCSVFQPLRNQDGSIIAITLMILVTITIIGLMSSDTVVSEKYIIRNQAIYKQNLNMVDAVLMEHFQRVMQWADTDPAIKDTNGSTLVWVNDMTATWAVTTTAWYAIMPSDAILNTANSIAVNTPQNLIDRGEQNNLRVAFVGWDKSGSSLTLPSRSTWKGRLIAEYVSPNNGIMRMEIGIRKMVTSL